MITIIKTIFNVMGVIHTYLMIKKTLIFLGIGIISIEFFILTVLNAIIQ